LIGEALRESHAVFLVTPECCSRVRMAALARDLGKAPHLVARYRRHLGQLSASLVDQRQ